MNVVSFLTRLQLTSSRKILKIQLTRLCLENVIASFFFFFVSIFYCLGAIGIPVH